MLDNSEIELGDNSGEELAEDDPDDDLCITPDVYEHIADVLRAALDDPRLAPRALKLQARLIEDANELAEELGLPLVFDEN